MRISQQNIVQNLVNAAQSPQVSSELKALIGKVLSGQITDIQSNQTATFLTDKGQLKVDINGASLQNNQQVELKITDVKDGMLVAKLITSGGVGDQTSSLSEILSKLGISENVENTAIVEAMKQANIPITQDNFKGMRQSMVEVRALLSELTNQVLSEPLNQLETPIKSLALKLMQQQQTDVPKLLPSLLESNSVELPLAMNDKTTNTTANTDDNITTSKSLNDMPSSTALKGALDLSVSQTSDLIKSSEGTAHKVGGTNFTSFEVFDKALFFKAIADVFGGENNASNPNGSNENIKSLLGQFDYQQSSLIYKNELPITLKNIFLAYDTLSEDSGITARFTKVINNLDFLDLSNESLGKMVKILLSDDSQNEKLEQMIRIIEKEAPDTTSKNLIEKELAVIKESSIFNKPLNEQMMYMQIPVQMNQQLKNVDIYYKKNNKKPNPDDLTLLVALNTFNFGEVRCVVHKVKNQYNLSFGFKDEETMNYFENYKQQLVKQLENQEDKKFVISFNVKSVVEMSDSLSEENSETSKGYNKANSFGIDVKI